MKAKVICAWCKTTMGLTDTYSGNDTHGICITCIRARFPKIADQIFADIIKEAARRKAQPRS